MKYIILHNSSRRMRIQLPQRRMSLQEVDQLEEYLTGLPCVRQATVNERTCHHFLYRRSETDIGRPSFLLL